MADGWIDFIEECHRSRRLIAVSVESQKNGAFFAGYVTQLSDEGFLLEFVNKYGEPGEGGATEAWFEYCEIDEIKVGTPYLIGLERLVSIWPELSSLRRGRRRTSQRGIRQLCRRALREGGVVTLFEGYEERAITVAEMQPYLVRGTMIGDDGTAQGEVMIRFGAIHWARRGIDEAAQAALHHHSPPILGAG